MNFIHIMRVYSHTSSIFNIHTHLFILESTLRVNNLNTSKKKNKMFPFKQQIIYKINKITSRNIYKYTIYCIAYICIFIFNINIFYLIEFFFIFYLYLICTKKKNEKTNCQTSLSLPGSPFNIRRGSRSSHKVSAQHTHTYTYTATLTHTHVLFP